ncbi:hypothetical protein HK405_002611, partial [Cladochytrium tenue]
MDGALAPRLPADVVAVVATFAFAASAPSVPGADAAARLAFRAVHTELARVCRAWHDAVTALPLTVAVTLF